MADRVLLGQFRVQQQLALMVLAAALRRGAGPSGPAVRWVQATVVSSEGATVTVTFDGVTNVGGVERLEHYTPVVGDVVEVRAKDGKLLIFGAKA